MQWRKKLVPGPFDRREHVPHILTAAGIRGCTFVHSPLWTTVPETGQPAFPPGFPSSEAHRPESGSHEDSSHRSSVRKATETPVPLPFHPPEAFHGNPESPAFPTPISG